MSVQAGDRVFLALLVVLVEEEALAWGLPRVLSELWFWDPCFWDSDLFLSGSGGDSHEVSG